MTREEAATTAAAIERGLPSPATLERMKAEADRLERFARAEFDRLERFDRADPAPWTGPERLD